MYTGKRWRGLQRVHGEERAGPSACTRGRDGGAFSVYMGKRWRGLQHVHGEEMAGPSAWGEMEGREGWGGVMHRIV